MWLYLYDRKGKGERMKTNRLDIIESAFRIELREALNRMEWLKKDSVKQTFTIDDMENLIRVEVKISKICDCV